MRSVNTVVVYVPRATEKDMHIANTILRALLNFTFLACLSLSGMDSNFFGVELNKPSAILIRSVVTVEYAKPSSRVFANPISKAAAPAAAAPFRTTNATGRLKVACVAVAARAKEKARHSAQQYPHHSLCDNLGG